MSQVLLFAWTSYQSTTFARNITFSFLFFFSCKNSTEFRAIASIPFTYSTCSPRFTFKGITLLLLCTSAPTDAHSNLLVRKFEFDLFKIPCRFYSSWWTSSERTHLPMERWKSTSELLFRMQFLLKLNSLKWHTQTYKCGNWKRWKWQQNQFYSNSLMVKFIPVQLIRSHVQQNDPTFATQANSCLGELMHSITISFENRWYQLQ